MHRREIEKLIGKTKEKGLTLVPTRLYFSGRHAKVEIALGRGKDAKDKRHAIKDREMKREIERSFQALGEARGRAARRDDPLGVQLVVRRVVVLLDLVERERLGDVRL